MSSPLVAVSIDTEEDDWGSYAERGASVKNIAEVPAAQAVFDRWGVRPTYLVNLPPLDDDTSLGVLRELSTTDSVEIGGHCHPWNTPPVAQGRSAESMMCRLSVEENRGKLGTIRSAIEDRLGVEPRSFRAGRWGFGESVSVALSDLGFEIDTSVSPLVDWSTIGGPDYTRAPLSPYRFDPADPLRPQKNGAMVELPVTIGALRGDSARAAMMRARLGRSFLSRAKLVGALDTVGRLAVRWLSPENSSAEEMIRLARKAIDSDRLPFLHLTFHSCTLLAGATPFVRNEQDARRFLESLDRILEYLHGRGCRFATLSEAASLLGLRPTDC